MKERIISESGERITFSKRYTEKEQSEIFYNTPSRWAEENLYYLDMFGTFVCTSRYRVERGSFDSYLVIRTTAGSGTIINGFGTLVCGPDDFALVDCNLPHLYYANENWQFEWFHFNGSSSRQLSRMILENAGNVVRMPSASLAHMLFHDIVTQSEDASVWREAMISAQIHMILSAMLAATLDSRSGGRTNERLREAIAYIDAHFAEKLTVEEVAQHLNVSKSGFAHTFKKKMGFSPYEFITNKRISKAKELLKSTQESVADIAWMTGFSSPANFIRTFRERTGQTPTEYRKMRNVPSDFIDVYFGRRLYSDGEIPD